MACILNCQKLKKSFVKRFYFLVHGFSPVLLLHLTVFDSHPLPHFVLLLENNFLVCQRVGLILFIQDSCLSSPCLSNATCQVGFGDHGYHCVCPSSYYRDRCQLSTKENTFGSVKIIITMIMIIIMMMMMMIMIITITIIKGMMTILPT